MKLPYRPEIEGLRTIAVLSVILYHAQIAVFGHDFFKGGFVGVDIFFNISGYLISLVFYSASYLRRVRLVFYNFMNDERNEFYPYYSPLLLSHFH